MRKIKFLRNLFMICLLCFYAYSGAAVIDVNDLAMICKALEGAITDASFEYEWYNIPPSTPKDVAGTGNFITQGANKYSITTKFPFEEHYLVTNQAVLVNQHGDSFKNFVKVSYDGQCAKRFDSGGLPIGRVPHENEKFLSGTVSKTEHTFLSSLQISPLGFTILRTQLDGQNLCLSDFMLNKKELVRIADKTENINGFETVRVDFLIEGNPKGYAFRIVYFSIDHNYTPVRFEYMNGQNVALRMDITSLVEVQEGLWFPASGKTSSPRKEGDVGAFKVTGDVIINQGLDDDVFDLTFPPGTKVSDRITGKQYRIRPTQEQVDASMPQQ